MSGAYADSKGVSAQADQGLRCPCSLILVTIEYKNVVQTSRSDCTAWLADHYLECFGFFFKVQLIYFKLVRAQYDIISIEDYISSVTYLRLLHSAHGSLVVKLNAFKIIKKIMYINNKYRQGFYRKVMY